MNHTDRRIETWPIERLIPFENNAKLHPPEQITELANQINEFGYDVFIVVEPDGTIIKGHGRRLAIMELGWKEVQVIVRDDMTPEQMRVARLTDNAVADLGGGYDADLLKVEFDAVSAFDDMETDLSFILGVDVSGNAFEESESVTPKYDPSDIPAGLKEEVYEPQYLITFTAKDESEQERAYNLLCEAGYQNQCKVQSM